MANPLAPATSPEATASRQRAPRVVALWFLLPAPTDELPQGTPFPFVQLRVPGAVSNSIRGLPSPPEGCPWLASHTLSDDAGQASIAHRMRKGIIKDQGLPKRPGDLHDILPPSLVPLHMIPHRIWISNDFQASAPSLCHFRGMAQRPRLAFIQRPTSMKHRQLWLPSPVASPASGRSAVHSCGPGGMAPSCPASRC